MRTSHRNNLDVMRTLLALGVLNLHVTGLEHGVFGVGWLQLPWVPAFITLSGYLITESMQRSRGYGHFAWKRVLRVGPAFLLSLALVAALGGSVASALFDWAMMGLATTRTNGPLWSLSVEEVLYALLALWFALGVYRTDRRALLVLAGLFGLVALAGTYAIDTQFRICRVTLCFICGSLLYVTRDRIRWSAIGGVACLALAMWLRTGALGPDQRVLAAALVAPAIAYALLYFAFHAPPVFAGYKQQIGDLSLGIYVYHWPILQWLEAHGAHGSARRLGTLLLVVAMAYLSWHLVEKHALKLKDWRPGKRVRALETAA